MNIGKIYADAIRVEQKEKPEIHVETKNDDEVKVAKVQWLQSSATEELLNKLIDERNKLLSQCVSLAVGYGEHDTHIKIIMNLIRVDQLNKNIETIKKV